MRAFPVVLLAAAVPLGAADDFSSRLQAYRKLRDQATSHVSKLKPTASPDQIAKHEQQVANRIREARENAQQGNIFTREIAAQFRRMIDGTMRGPGAVTVRQSLARSEPVNLKELAVNQEYPKGVPLQTTPPSLLANLPRLPNGFEYRVVGSAIVLLDVEADLIIDYIPNAIPTQ